MRLTDHLVRSVGTAGACVWWHSTNHETVLVGPSMYSAYRDEAPIAIRVVRRPTGGGAVLAGPGVLAVDVALPASHWLLTGDVVEDYRWFGNVWVDALLRVDVGAHAVDVEEARMMTARYDRNPDAKLVCFGTAGPYEVLCKGRKIVGLSQVRRSGGVLFSAAVHLDVEPHCVAAALPIGPRRRIRLATHLKSSSASIAEVAQRPVTAREMMGAVGSALIVAHGIRLQDGVWPDLPA